MVAGTHSGVGKTTVATGLMAALRRRGMTVSSAKVGPDFIDPGYHAAATGRPGRNLDAFLSGASQLAPLAARAGDGSDVLVVEGVMGLFDGMGATSEASTAAVAVALAAPVVLVVDASSMSASVAAVVHGFHTHHRDVRLAGVVLNRVAGASHEDLLRQALAGAGVPVLGVLHRDDRLTWRDRHLGLVPVVERPGEVRRSLQQLGQTMAEGCDLAAIMAVARGAPATATAAPPQAQPAGRARVAVAGGPAFSFGYTDNLEQLRAAGAELVSFDPIHDEKLPEGTEALYAGGGFPEVFAEALGANEALLHQVRRRVASGMTTWAECGGLLWLARSLAGQALCGAVAADAAMSPVLTLGYRSAEVLVANPVAPAGSLLRGHEFHYSRLEPAGAALRLWSRHGSVEEGHGTASLLGTYLHLHLGADPAPAERFVATATRRTTASP